MKWSSVAIRVDCEWDPVTTSGIRDPVVHHIKCTIKKKKKCLLRILTFRSLSWNLTDQKGLGYFNKIQPPKN